MDSLKTETIESVRAEAEEYLIAVGFMAPDLIEPMSAIAAPRDFFDPVIGKIWQMMVDFVSGKDQKCDAQMFLLEAKKRGYIDELGGVANLVKMINKQPNHAHYEYYAREVARFTELRRLDAAVHHVRNLLDSPTADPQKVIAAFQARTEGIGNSKDAGFVKLFDVISHLIEKTQAIDDSDPTNNNEVILSGLPSLDHLIRGFEKSKLYLLGGRTGMGKSALAENFALHAACSGHPVWFCSLEMQREEIGQRAFSSFASVDLSKWRRRFTEQDLMALKTFQERVLKTKFWITDRPAESVNTIRAKARLRKSLEGLDMIIIDNLQLVRPFDFKPPKHERLKLLTEAFKEMAKELDVAIVLLGQLTAESEKDGSEPDNTSWAGSKAIVDDADVAMLLHRENRDAKTAKLIISKHRGGPVGSVNLNWAGKYQTFSDAHVDELEGSFN